MTLKEKVKEVEPKNVSDGHRGGVFGCPSGYGYLKDYYSVYSCGKYDEKECEACWNREYISAESDTEAVDHPAHYQGAHECIDVMCAMFGVEAVKSFCKCNAYKYRFRAGRKEIAEHDEDIKKAEWYEGKLIELEATDEK